MSHSSRLPALLLALGAACADPSTSPTERTGGLAPVTVSAAITGTLIEGLTIEVTGPGIVVPIIANVPATGVQATGTVQVPAGRARLFTVRGFDAAGVHTHEGTATADVRPAANPAVAVRLYPVTGTTPIVVTVGSYTLTLGGGDADGDTVALGGTKQYTATIARDGAPVPGAVVTWASLNPVVASVSPAGLATALAEGETRIVASYAGVAAQLPFTVTAAPAGVAIAPSPALGHDHTCALRAAGAAWCWGDNAFGQVGDGTSAQWRLAPVPVVGGLAFARIASAAYATHSCALTTAGVAYCWGLNSTSQLGTGTAVDQSAVPMAVAGGRSYAALGVGSEHACALEAGGAAWCWGRNTNGQLGDGTWTERGSPVLVPGAPAFARVAAGGAHTCALTSAGAAWCWGDNYRGQLGDGTREERTAPVTVLGGLAFTAIAAGREHTCGLTAAGAAYCWGMNGFDGQSGRLGDGTTSDRLVPTAVAGGLAFVQISAGGDHTCARTLAGLAYCWGDNTNGQLGDGTTTDALVPTAVAGDLRFAAVGASLRHSCGVLADGGMRCWGANGAYGRLGDGSTATRLTPSAAVFP